MDMRLNSRLRAICAGGFVLLSFVRIDAAAQSHPPEYPPTSDADPSVRHELEVPMPTHLSVQRTANRLSIAFDPAAQRKVKITVGRKMTLGVKYELRVYAKGDARPVDSGGVGYAGFNEPDVPSDLGFLNGVTFLTRAHDGIPAPGKRYVIEEDVSLFETDVPPQHMWNPNTRRYRLLWEEKLTIER